MKKKYLIVVCIVSLLLIGFFLTGILNNSSEDKETIPVFNVKLEAGEYVEATDYVLISNDVGGYIN